MKNSSTADKLIAQFYDAIPIERGWQDCLDAYVRAVGGNSGTIAWRHEEEPFFEIATIGIDDRNFLNKYLKEIEPFNPFHDFFRLRSPGDIAAVGSLAFEERYLNSFFFNEWAKPQRFGDLLAGRLVGGPAAHGWLSIRRDYTKGVFPTGEVALARRVAPHLVRALSLWMHLRSVLVEVVSMSAALDAFRCAVILVDADARILHANRLAELALSHKKALIGVRGRIASRRHDETTALRTAIRHAAYPALHDLQESALALHGESGDVSIVHAIPLSTHSRWGVLGKREATVGLFISDRAHGRPRGLDAFNSCYRLTRMEGRVLGEILAGGGLVQAAEHLEISPTTARSHLQQVFAKTGTRKQAELVRMYFEVTASL